jgi:cystathionine beta-lyase
MKFDTKAIHAGVEPDPATGAIMTPIYQTSTYVQEAVGKHKGFEYSRSNNPTRKALEASLAALENGNYGACFASGLAAIDCVIKMLSPGDEVISTNDLYGGTYRLFSTIFAKFGIVFHYVSMGDVDNVARLVNEKTRLIWVETPTNPMLNIIDIEAMASLTRGKDIMLAVDNTFSTPYNQRPLELGADIVMHSVTKYLGGHSDVLMGALVTRDENIASEMYRIQNSSGAVCGPQDAFLVLRGVKTLHLRMERHGQNGARVASFLRTHPAVDKVYFAGLEEHPNHEIAKKQMKSFTGMVSFTLKEDTLEAAHRVLNNCKLFSLAESLGGVESLIGHPATMTHASIPADLRRKSGVVDSLIRLSMGIEDADDLIQDLDRALNFQE